MLENNGVVFNFDSDLVFPNSTSPPLNVTKTAHLVRSEGGVLRWKSSQNLNLIFKLENSHLGAKK